MNRKAPDGGYEFSAKSHYRRNIWATFRDRAKFEKYVRADSDVLLMPSIEGKEIEVAENAGFRQNRMHVVDASAGIVADLKKRYPSINTYAVGFPPDGGMGKAGDRIAAKGIRLRFANLDLCGPVAPHLSHELSRFARSGCLDDIAYVAVTMLRGREQHEATRYLTAHIDLDDMKVKAGRQSRGAAWHSIFDGLSDRDILRQSFIGCHLAYLGFENALYSNVVTPVRCEVYKSSAGSQTMIWSIWRVIAFELALAARLIPGIPEESARELMELMEMA